MKGKWTEPKRRNFLEHWKVQDIFRVKPGHNAHIDNNVMKMNYKPSIDHHETTPLVCEPKLRNRAGQVLI